MKLRLKFILSLSVNLERLAERIRMLSKRAIKFLMTLFDLEFLLHR